MLAAFNNLIPYTIIHDQNSKIGITSNVRKWKHSEEYLSIMESNIRLLDLSYINKSPNSNIAPILNLINYKKRNKRSRVVGKRGYGI
jgi:hypothetical protein